MASTLHTKQNTPNTLSSISSGAGQTYTLNTGAGVTGTAGQFLTTGGSNGTSMSSAIGTVSWAPQPTNFVSSGGKSIMTVPHGEQTVVLEKAATLDVKGTVRINGIDLEERLKTIERVLCIPERDAIMEAKYPSLKKKYDEYINTLEKYKTFERIKGEEDGTT